MLTLINELNKNNSTNYKIEVLEKHKENTLFKKVVKMTYDKVAYTYGITMKNVESFTPIKLELPLTLESALASLEANFCTRNITGNDALQMLSNILYNLEENDAKIIKGVIGRDLKVNLGRTQFNKVWKNLIIKPVYNRCDIYTIDKTIQVEDKKSIKLAIKEQFAGKVVTKEDIKKISKDIPLIDKVVKGTSNNINFEEGAIVQLKADGTYREISSIGNNTNSISRSGEAYSYPAIEKSILEMNEDGYLTGELTVKLTDDLLAKLLPKLEKADIKNGTKNVETIKRQYAQYKEDKRVYILPRSIGNGLINSDNIPYDNLIYEVWDFITPEDYSLAGLKDKKNLPKIKYRDRFNKLIELVNKIDVDNIQVIDYRIVNSLKEATDYTTKVMNMGLEGAILKDFDMLFKDGTSANALKLKISFSLDVEITGFIEGTPGTKRERTFGSMIYSTQDGMIKGSFSGFNDEQLEDFNSRREELIGTIVEIEGNDLTKGRNNQHYAVSHPRFIELRSDKTYTDDIDRALLMLESAKNFTDIDNLEEDIVEISLDI